MLIAPAAAPNPTTTPQLKQDPIQMNAIMKNSLDLLIVAKI